MESVLSNQGETLDRIAKVIRSKNAGPFEITFDIMFDDPVAYQRVKRSGVIEPVRIAAAYRIPSADVLVCKPFDAALAFKVTIRRQVSSGDIEDNDVYGCQQHVPLTGIVVPMAERGYDGPGQRATQVVRGEQDLTALRDGNVG